MATRRKCGSAPDKPLLPQVTVSHHRSLSGSLFKSSDFDISQISPFLWPTLSRARLGWDNFVWCTDSQWPPPASGCFHSPDFPVNEKCGEEWLSSPPPSFHQRSCVSHRHPTDSWETKLEISPRGRTMFKTMSRWKWNSINGSMLRVTDRTMVRVGAAEQQSPWFLLQLVPYFNGVLAPGQERHRLENRICDRNKKRATAKHVDPIKQSWGYEIEEIHFLTQFEQWLVYRLENRNSQ